MSVLKLPATSTRPNLLETPGGVLQNFAILKGNTELYMAINMYVNLRPVRKQSYDNVGTQDCLTQSISFLEGSEKVLLLFARRANCS